MKPDLEMAKRTTELFGSEPTGFMDARGIDIDPEGTYAWVRMKDYNMTNESHPNSIPYGSYIMIKKVTIKNLFDWPMKRPVCLMGVGKNGDNFAICHIITFIDETAQSIICSNLNPNESDFRVSMRYIHHVFTVEQILRPMEAEAVNIIPDLGHKTRELPGAEGYLLL